MRRSLAALALAVVLPFPGLAPAAALANVVVKPGETLSEIADRHGPVDFAMIPIGAYHPRRIMRPVHLNPDEAVQAFLDARCRRACGMHWGTFRLTDEPLGEPPLWLHQALNRAGLNPESFIPGIIGDIMKVTHKPTS